jgi:hypothetical protein
MSEIFKDVAIRFIKASNENHVLFNEELEILTHLVNKFKLISISEYAHKEGLTYPGAKKRIATKKVMTISLLGKVFVIQ